MDDKKGILMVITLLSIILGFIPSLVYWVVTKSSLEESLKKYVVNLLNFELTLFIVGIIIGVVMAPLAGIVSFINLILLIVATINLAKNKLYKFPLTIEMIK